MKNIHILPTDKPSRLYKSKITQDVFISDNRSQHGDATYNVNIYITSDEEIKEGDCVIDNVGRIWIKMELCFVKAAKDNPYGKSYKIILTTDQDLINNGVQEIDNEFLEWFVKNPSCEEVEIRKEMYMPQSNGKISDGKITHEISLDSSQNTLPYYKIIIPKEEQKQHLIDIMRGDEELGLYEEPKQETLEELAKEFYSDENQLMERIAFKRGYTECEERMYSEEDLRTAYAISKNANSFNEWFEEFKKK